MDCGWIGADDPRIAMVVGTKAAAIAPTRTEGPDAGTHPGEAAPGFEGATSASGRVSHHGEATFTVVG